MLLKVVGFVCYGAMYFFGKYDDMFLFLDLNIESDIAVSKGGITLFYG